MNTISICGRLTAQPELKTTQSGVNVCSFDLAVKRPKVKDTTDFLPVVAWRQSAEYISKYGHKGDMVAVTGVLTTRKWQDNNGNNRIAYEIVCDTVQIVSSAQQQNTAQPNQQMDAFISQARSAGVPVVDDQDLPF